MKKTKHGHTAMGKIGITTGTMALLTLSIVSANQAQADTTNQVAVYSVANKSDHYLTTDENRANSLVKYSGYNSKTLIGYLPTSGTKIHNWYSAKAGHYLTTDDTTKNKNRLKALGYKQMDGTTNLYSAKSTDDGSVPMYVWFNRQGNHYYNIDKNHVFKPAVYHNRSVAWYGFSKSSTTHTPVQSFKYIVDGETVAKKPTGSGYTLLSTVNGTKSVEKETLGDYTTTLTYHKIAVFTTNITRNVNESGDEIVPTDHMVKVGLESQTVVYDTVPILGDINRTVTTTQVWHLVQEKQVVVNLDELGNTLASTDGYFQLSTKITTKTETNQDKTTTTTNTWHKIAKNTVTINKDESGNDLGEFVNTKEYKEISRDSKTSTSDTNGDITTTVTVIWHNLVKATIVKNVEDIKYTEITDTSGLVFISESTSQVTDPKTGEVTKTVTKVWHKPVRLDSEDAYTLDGKTADPDTIDSQFDWITLVGETSVKTNVQANGDYTEVYISAYQSRTISQSEFQTLFSDMMTAALINQKKDLVAMYPIDAEYMLERTMTPMTAEEDKKMGGNVQQAVDNCAVAGKLYHNSYGSYQAQNIAKVGTNPVAGYTYATAKYIVDKVIEMNWNEKAALDASKYGPGYTAFNEDNGHLYNVLYSQEVISAINYDSKTNIAYIAMNFL